MTMDSIEHVQLPEPGLLGALCSLIGVGVLRQLTVALIVTEEIRSGGDLLETMQRPLRRGERHVSVEHDSRDENLLEFP